MRKIAILNAMKYVDDHMDLRPFDSDDDDDNFHWDDWEPGDPIPDKFFVGGDEKIVGPHRDQFKVTLFLLMFSGFERTLKCPFSQVYSDLAYLYNCPLPDTLCRNCNFDHITYLRQHADSKSCLHHQVLSKSFEFWGRIQIIYKCC